MVIAGLSDLVEAGTQVRMTCSINRIKPEATEMYWTIRGNRVDGFPTLVANGDGTHKQTITTNLRSPFTFFFLNYRKKKCLGLFHF